MFLRYEQNNNFMRDVRFKLGFLLAILLIVNFLPVTGNAIEVTIDFEYLSDIATGGAPFDVQIKGDTAFVSDYNGGLSAFDISNASDPSLLDNLPLIRAHYFHVVGDFAFIACWDYGLQIINITDPTNLIAIGNYDDGTNVGGTFVSNDIALVTKTDGGVLILNVSNPTQPERISQFNDTGIPNVVTVWDDVAFVVYWKEDGSRVLFLDISDPAAPTLIGQYTDIADTYDIHVRDDLLIIANDLMGVFFVNISNLANSEKITEYDTGGLSLGVDTIDNYLFVGDSHTIEVIDFSDFSKLRNVGSYDDTEQSQKLQIVDDLVFVCNNPKGLVILQYTIEELTSTSIILILFPTFAGFAILTFLIIYSKKKK